MKSSAIVSRLIYDRDEFVLGNFRYTFIAYIYICSMHIASSVSGYIQDILYPLYCNFKLLHDISIENMFFLMFLVIS